jgi:hypothetical protein
MNADAAGFPPRRSVRPTCEDQLRAKAAGKVEDSGTMRINAHNSMRLAFGMAGAVCILALNGEAGDSPSVATKTTRPTVIANASMDHVVVPSRPAGVSVLCRLPIQIANWNIIFRPSRCN